MGRWHWAIFPLENRGPKGVAFLSRRERASSPGPALHASSSRLQCSPPGAVAGLTRLLPNQPAAREDPRLRPEEEKTVFPRVGIVPGLVWGDGAQKGRQVSLRKTTNANKLCIREQRRGSPSESPERGVNSRKPANRQSLPSQLLRDTCVSASLLTKPG